MFFSTFPSPRLTYENPKRSAGISLRYPLCLRRSNCFVLRFQSGFGEAMSKGKSVPTKTLAAPTLSTRYPKAFASCVKESNFIRLA